MRTHTAHSGWLRPTGRRAAIAILVVLLALFATHGPENAGANAVAEIKGDAHTLDTALLGLVGANVNGITLPPNPSSAGGDLDEGLDLGGLLGLLEITADDATVGTACSGDTSGPVVRAECSSELEALSVTLAGISLVTADRVSAHSTTTSDGGPVATSAAESTITNLCVAGTACLPEPGMNTSVSGSLIGVVDIGVQVLATEDVTDDGMPGSGLRVTALRINLSLPIIGTPVAEIELVQAYSFLGNVVNDDSAPDTTLVNVPSDPSDDTSFPFTFTGDDGAGSGVDHFECSLNGAPFAACVSGDSVGPFNEGSNTFEVRAVDGAGNPDPTPASHTWTVDTTSDTTAPDTTLVNVPSDPSSATSFAFTFTGSDDVGVDHFECSLNGAPFAACVSGDSVGPFSEGSNTFEVRAVDGAGNPDPTPASHTWTVDTTSDTTAPDTTLVNVPSDPSDDTSFPFTFTGDDGAGSGVDHFECSLNGAPFAACVSGDSVGPFNEGSNTFEVRAVDSAGNPDPTPASHTWTVDTGTPDTTLVNVPADPSDDTSFPFTFTGDDGAGSGVDHFECSLNGAPFAACVSGDSVGPFNEGSNTFEVRAVDGAGNPDPTPASHTWTVDTGAPDTTLVNVPSDPSDDTSFPFTFTGDDGAGSGVDHFECSLNGAPFAACLSGDSVGPFSEGSNTFEVRAVDGAGNPDPTPASHTWTVDTGAPDTTLVNVPSDPSDDTSFPFTFTGDDGAGSGVDHFECSLNGAPFAACVSGDSVGPFSEGSNTFEVRAVDGAGNPDPTPASHTWTVDTGAPDTTLVNVPSDPSDDTSFPFTFTGDDGAGSGVDHFECSLNGAPFAACVSGDSVGPFSEGSNTFEVRAVDGAGNPDPTPASHTWTVDTTSGPLLPPEHATGTSTTSSTTITWTDPNPDEDGYDIYRCGPGGCFVYKASVGADVTTWTDNDVTPGTYYAYWVRATRGSDVAWADTFITVISTSLQPTRPQPQTAVGTGEQAVTLTWLDRSDDEEGFHILRYDAGAWTLKGTVGANVTTWTDTTAGLAAGSEYAYWVVSYNGAAWSYAEFFITGRTWPADYDPAPDGLAAPTYGAVTVSGTTATIAWADNATDETGYEVYRCGPDGCYVPKSGLLAAGTTSWEDTDVAPGEYYAYWVRAVRGGDVAWAANAITVITTSLRPASPQPISAHGSSETSIVVTWLDNSDDEDGFRILRYESGTWVQRGLAAADVTTWTDTGLTAGTEYAYWVVADRGGQDSFAHFYIAANTWP